MSDCVTKSISHLSFSPITLTQENAGPTRYIRQRQASRGSTSSSMKVLVVFALVALSAAAAWPGFMSDEPDGELYPLENHLSF